MPIRKMIKAAWLLFLALCAVMSWGTTVLASANANESIKEAVNRAVNAQPLDQAIPEDAIRLRILAHSDDEADQAVKHLIRDRIVERMNHWLAQGEEPSTQEEARELIESHLHELQVIAQDALKEAGMLYGADAKLDTVAFPAKLYGGEVYPAGQYEALLITLGEGEGQNWWCVLFPPLCFVDGTQGTATAPEDGEPVSAGNPEDGVVEQTVEGAAATAEPEQEREVRFFLWDMLVAIGEFIRSMFTAIFG